MSKYGVTLVYKERRYIEVDAEDEDEAAERAYEQSNEAEPMGDDDIEVEDIENLEE